MPPEYYEFRALLQEAIADTVASELRGDVEMQERLDSRLSDLSAILLVDSLIVDLDTDPVLWPVAGAVTFALNRTLNSDEVGGSVRDAIQNRDGQRQAVDAIVIGLGLALRRVRTEGARGRDAAQALLVLGRAVGKEVVERQPAHLEDPLYGVSYLVVRC